MKILPSSVTQELWDNLEGWDGEGSGRGVQEGGMCIGLTDSC